MFVHGKTNKKYYSVREKINYYNKVLKGQIVAPLKTRRKAKLRLKTLNKINNQLYNEPRLIVTDDKHFGNSISKPRLCIAYGTDKKGRIKVYSIEKRSSNIIILDNNIDRQISSKYKFLDKSDVYETKYILGVKPLTKNTKQKIKYIHK